MQPTRVGLVVDPAAPTELAQGMADLSPLNSSGPWDITVVSEPFTTGSEDVATAVGRLQDHARQQDWDLVVGLTELPLHDHEGRHVLVETDPERRTAVLSLPALGGLRMHARSRRAVRSLLSTMMEPSRDDDEHRVVLPRRRGHWRLLQGMVLANRPWLLIDGELSDRPDDGSPQARERSRLYNASTVVTLMAGVFICCVALSVVNLAWAFFVLDPDLMGSYLRASLGYGDMFVLAWFVASAATVGGVLGSGLESDEAIRAAAYSKREEDRRDRLARRKRSP
jgi:hypothetical protein